ncbi:S9 family peptidase [Lacihabitans sp. CS3-21]|uniref:alpha/beta hydrolase family protein n=1 Tax=Lacihabitans sp. CS3-21 TaxID=2487332 RepID=UPI0020CE3350|nr:prolyl oligopeptidase family serine peptidase [Lacihabitans sp. CS3-21]MCP9746150.1 S9 family peptidase [Lacihabitans sp. CS3-21]
MKQTLFFLLLLSTGIFAQKRPLQHSDYDAWKAISETKITPNGHWVAYVLSPQDGDNKLILYPLLGNAIDTVERASDLWLSQDSQWGAYKISPSKSIVKAAKLAKKKKEDMPKDSIGIHSFTTFETIKFGNIKSFIFPEKSNDWLAFLSYPETKKDTSSKVKKTKKESEENGSTLQVYSLKNNALHKFPFVYKYQFDPTGQILTFATTGKDSTMKAGLYSFSTTDQKTKLLTEVKGTYKQLISSEDGQLWATILDPDTTKKSLTKNHTLYFWKNTEEPKLIGDTLTPTNANLPLISTDFEPKFSKDGSKLFFGKTPRGIIKDTTKLEEDIVSLDVWNWKDNRLMPQQLANLKNDLKKSYLAVFDIKTQKTVQLANPDFPEISLTKTANEEEMLLLASEKYAYQHWLFNPPIDAFTVSSKTENRKLVFENKRVTDLHMSPDGKFVVWYALEDTAWFAYQVRNQKTYKLTDDVNFSDKADDDHPDEPSSYGMAGFTKDDDQVWIYDKYDIWAVNLSKPSERKRLTNGRENNLSYRYISLDEKETQIDTKNVILLHVFNQKTMESGYATLSITENAIPELVMFDKFYFSPKIIKAKESSDLVFTQENFEVFPDLQHSKGVDFKEVRKVSTANPQQENINWGTAEMIKYQSLDNKDLEGILYKPANFDPSKKYPMITYFYEKMSDQIYRYNVPQPARSSINFSYYPSNGYCVFVPDIVYKTGQPGQSAYDCILPGIKKVIEMGFVDSTRLGVQGHSWGGYQIAWLVTKTNIFRAAEAGAPVANMTSAYGGIRWETGNSRQAQYERTQSRIGLTLWDNPKKYLENSPLFYLPNVKTPVLMMHNDDDGAVPWYQGIEMFMGLKRLGKPVWMLNYNGEKHGLTQRKNRKDWSLRMSQYFDYYLKDAPIPEWMSKGVPATEKTLNYGLKLD